MFGFYRLAAAVPRLFLADVKSNTQEIIKLCRTASEKGTTAVVFPEMCITGYTIGDLVFQKTLLDAAENAAVEIARATCNSNIIVIVGLPLRFDDRIYNTALVIQNGCIAGAVPKQQLVNYREYHEKRYFASGRDVFDSFVNIGDQVVPFGSDLIFSAGGEFKFGVEICEDLWSVNAPSGELALAGALALFNLACCTEYANKAALRRELIKVQSAKLNAAYVFASGGVYESTTDAVCSGHALIAENGNIAAENKRFMRDSSIIYSDVDLQTLASARRTDTSFFDNESSKSFCCIELPDDAAASPDLSCAVIDPTPLLPAGEDSPAECMDIFNIQIAGLARRFEHSHSKSMVIGVSGGLDSTLALLVAYECTKLLGLPADTVKAYIMPGFGTTRLTRGNSEKLCDALNIPVKAIDITPSCRQHFADIEHDPADLSNTYENVQARERTQILMDIANKTGGMVIGTGDLSEMALGWCTYNGDHMSMYAVNSSIPKTLIRVMVKHIAGQHGGVLQEVLESILNTPVSPELLPPDKTGGIEQKTEDIIGPYELHDFFIYHFVKNNSTPEKIAALACEAWKGVYSKEVIEKTLKIFLKRFFQQQFKRSCSPDGVQATAVSFSPRGAWQMPSDAAAALWLER